MNKERKGKTVRWPGMVKFNEKIKKERRIVKKQEKINGKKESNYRRV